MLSDHDPVTKFQRQDWMGPFPQDYDPQFRLLWSSGMQNKMSPSNNQTLKHDPFKMNPAIMSLQMFI